MGYRYSSPSNWPAPPSADWVPPQGWSPDPSWGPAPKGWNFWVSDPPTPTAATMNGRTASARPRPGQWLAHHPFRIAQLNITLWAVVGLLVFLTGVGAVAGTAPSKNGDAASVAVQTMTGAISGSPTPAPPSPTSSPPAAPTALVAPNPIPTDSTGRIKVNAAGAVLPNSALTPGAINPSVNQANIGQTICVTGWTATVRPPSSVTTGLKVHQLASGYAYNGDVATRDYEEDHLIALELGGAPSAETNLWPEPYNTPEGARVKDVLENKLHTLVCGGTITLVTAQRAIATNWWTAYQTYVG